MNKQPFYVCVSFLFTATRDISAGDMASVVKAIAAVPDVLEGSIQIEYVTSEAGDPADLMG
jgi:hypothetical protein